MLELKAQQLGIDVNQLAEAQQADSYYGEFDEDDEEMHDPVAIQE